MRILIVSSFLANYSQRKKLVANFLDVHYEVMLSIIRNYLTSEDLVATIPFDLCYFVTLHFELFCKKAIVFIYCYPHEFSIDVLLTKRIKKRFPRDLWFICVIS